MREIKGAGADACIDEHERIESEKIKVKRGYMTGNFLLNWGVLVVGIVIFYFGCIFLFVMAIELKKCIVRHGRMGAGKKYGTSWNRSDTIGAVGFVIFWNVVITGVPGTLLFFFTSLAKIGLPLWIGCTLSIAGVLLFFLALAGGTGIAKRDAEAAIRRLRSESEEQRQDDNKE